MVSFQAIKPFGLLSSLQLGPGSLRQTHEVFGISPV
jgi:hypothetical protein